MMVGRALPSSRRGAIRGSTIGTGPSFRGVSWGPVVPVGSEEGSKVSEHSTDRRVKCSARRDT